MKRRAARAIVTAALAASVLVGASACGFDAQTLQPYTQAQGVNVDSKVDPATNQPLVKARNLMIVSRSDGEGFMSGALFAKDGDELTGVSIQGKTADGSLTGPLSVDFPGSIELPAGGVGQLFGDQTITVSGDAVRMGFSAEVTLTFAEAGDVTVTTPIVDGDLPDFETMEPQSASGN